MYIVLIIKKFNMTFELINKKVHLKILNFVFNSEDLKRLNMFLMPSMMAKNFAFDFIPAPCYFRHAHNVTHNRWNFA